MKYKEYVGFSNCNIAAAADVAAPPATTNTASSNSLTRTTRTRTVPQLPLCDNDSYIGNDIDGNTAGTKATTIVDVHDATAKHE